MLSKEEIEKVKKGLIEELDRTITANECGLSTNDFSKDIKILEGALKYIEQLETDKQELIEKLKERIKSVEKCYDELVKPYYDQFLNIYNLSCFTKKEKEEFINKRNCLLVQMHCYEEILLIVKGEERNGS